VLKLAVPEEDSERAQEQWEHWAKKATEVVAPPLIWYEVTSVLRNRAHRGRLTLDESGEALEALLGLSISIVSPIDLQRKLHDDLVDRDVGVQYTHDVITKSGAMKVYRVVVFSTEVKRYG